MSTPLERLVTASQAVTGPESLDSFLAGPGPALLLFTGDPAQRREAQDVAVVAGELKRAVSGLRVGVVAHAAEDAVKGRFHVSAVPTVVFLKDGRAISTVTRLQDWTVYQRTAQVVFGHREAQS